MLSVTARVRPITKDYKRWSGSQFTTTLTETVSDAGPSAAYVEDDAKLEDRDADALCHRTVVEIVVLLIAHIMVRMCMSVHMSITPRLDILLCPVTSRFKVGPDRRLLLLLLCAPDRHDRFHRRDCPFFRKGSRDGFSGRMGSMARMADLVPARVVRVVMPQPALLEETGAGPSGDQFNEEDAKYGSHGDGGSPVVFLPGSAETG